MSNINENVFKICSGCEHVWETREDFINDENVLYIGYQANFSHLEAGFFLFNHDTTCRSTIALEVKKFRDLYDGPVFNESFMGSKFCQGLCTKKSNTERCENECECAFVREIIQVIKK